MSFRGRPGGQTVCGPQHSRRGSRGSRVGCVGAVCGRAPLEQGRSVSLLFLWFVHFPSNSCTVHTGGNSAGRHDLVGRCGDKAPFTETTKTARSGEGTGVNSREARAAERLATEGVQDTPLSTCHSPSGLEFPVTASHLGSAEEFRWPGKGLGLFFVKAKKKPSG